MHAPPRRSAAAEIDAALQRAREWEGAEAARKAEEERERRERDAEQPGYTVEQLEAMRAELQARIIEQQTHLQCDREAELRRQRGERLQIEIDELAARHAALVAERAMLVAKMG